MVISNSLYLVIFVFFLQPPHKILARNKSQELRFNIYYSENVLFTLFRCFSNWLDPSALISKHCMLLTSVGDTNLNTIEKEVGLLKIPRITNCLFKMEPNLILFSLENKHKTNHSKVASEFLLLFKAFLILVEKPVK